HPGSRRHLPHVAAWQALGDPARLHARIGDDPADRRRGRGLLLHALEPVHRPVGREHDHPVGDEPVDADVLHQHLPARLRLLPAAGRGDRDGGPDPPAGDPRRRVRSLLVRGGPHHQHGDRADHATRGAQSLRNQFHRPGDQAPDHPQGLDSLCRLHGPRDRHPLFLSRDRHIPPGHGDGTRKMRPISLRQWMTSVADRGRALLDLPPLLAAQGDSLEVMCRDLMGRRGEATSAALAREIASLWWRTPETTRVHFFRTLAGEFNPDPEAVAEAAGAYARAPGPSTQIALFRAVEPPRQELLRRINYAPGGTAALVSMRAALLELLPDHPELAAVDADFKHLLNS